MKITLAAQHQPQVVRFVMDECETSREFMKQAVELLVKDIIANGGLRVEKRYDIERGGYWECYSVLFGSPPRKLPA